MCSTKPRRAARRRGAAAELLLIWAADERPAGARGARGEGASRRVVGLRAEAGAGGGWGCSRGASLKYIYMWMCARARARDSQSGRVAIVGVCDRHGGTSALNLPALYMRSILKYVTAT